MAKAPVNVEDLHFEQLGDQELREVMARVNEALHARFTSRVQEFREFARDAGFTVILNRIGKEDGRQSRRQAPQVDRRRGVSPKYRNPDNLEETWAGRGRKPKWVEDRLSMGFTLDDLLINRSDEQEQSGALPEPEHGS
jgi:DNA-binding protein H-NS